MALKETLVKPVVAGATSAVALRMVYGSDATFTWGGSSYDITKFGFVLGLGNSFVSEVVTQFITPAFVSSSGQKYVSLAWNLGVSALTYSMIPKLISGSTMSSQDMLKLAGVGALVQVVSDYAYQNVIGGPDAVITY